MPGYIFFAFSILFYVGLALQTVSKPASGGDNAMGYGLALAFLGLGFGVSSLALTITLSARGGFYWVGAEAGGRTATVFAAWLCVVMTTFFCALFKSEWHSNDDNTYPQFLHGLAVWHGQLWLPLLWLAACFLSLNTHWQASLSPIALKAPFFAGLAISAVFCGGLAVGHLRDSVRQSEAEWERQQQQKDQWHQQTLDFIASQKPEDPIIGLLVHTNQFQQNDVRQAALTKIKTHPDWETEILLLLKNRNAYREVYYFLDGNKVTRSREFTEALNHSIGWLAETVAYEIKNSNNLQSWSFDSYGISQALRSIDGQFQHQHVDFRPTVRKLTQALKTSPTDDRFKGVKFPVTDEVDAWLNQHK
ncbi:hypothetical protein [Spirosoma sp. KNUC1025]|uniref:hypothetical protein n=1 Tax=Spirosoma sp. KNUC1025 TaxID=2894082 RepID=UPI00386A57F7|nr:hypothetical protein LN737_31015 [Spirosoma sp. KNUC1025]